MATSSFPAAIVAAAVFGLSGCASIAAGHRVVPPDARYDGKTYSQWAGAFWKWALELPPAGHPFNVCEDALAMQDGRVLYWAAPLSTCEVSATLAPRKALFLTLLTVESSSLEPPPFHGDNEAQQRANSAWLADHIVDLFCIIDGKPVAHLRDFRFSTPQIHFVAPSPWVFGDTGGPGTSVGDGYYLMLEPLSKGKHTIHYGGRFHFAAGELGPNPVDIPQDITIDLSVAPVSR